MASIEGWEPTCPYQLYSYGSNRSDMYSAQAAASKLRKFAAFSRLEVDTNFGVESCVLQLRINKGALVADRLRRTLRLRVFM